MAVGDHGFVTGKKEIVRKLFSLLNRQFNFSLPALLLLATCTKALSRRLSNVVQKVIV